MKKLTKTVIPLSISIILGLAICIFALYASIKFGQLPIDLPFMPREEYLNGEVPEQTDYIMDQWRLFQRYTPSEKITSIDELISSGELENIQEISKEELENIFPIVDQATLDNYIDKHPECMNNGYEMLLIDEVDLMNTPTGIKTTLGDDVLAIDAIDKIIIVGRDVVSDLGVSKVKIAFSYNLDQFNMSMVKNLSYWELIKSHAENNEAVLAINASGYNWRDTGAYATLYGALRFRGETFRKPSNVEDLIAFDNAKTMHIGYDIDDSAFAVEYFPVLIKDGEVVYNNESESEEIRNAMTALGQTQDGTIIMVVASGGVYGSNLGVTYSDLMQIMLDYNAYNAATLSGGSRTIMYWNGRIVNETVGYAQEGVRLPDAFYISYYSED